MSVVYLRLLEDVKQNFIGFISMETLAIVNNLSMEAVVEMATILELWRIVKTNVKVCTLEGWSLQF